MLSLIHRARAEAQRARGPPDGAIATPRAALVLGAERQRNHQSEETRMTSFTKALYRRDPAAAEAELQQLEKAYLAARGVPEETWGEMIRGGLQQTAPGRFFVSPPPRGSKARAYSDLGQNLR